MIRLYPEQLTAQLHEGLRGCYLVFGSDPLLLQESLDSIKRVAQQHEFSEHFSFILDLHTDWDAIFSTCQALSLFASRQTLMLSLPENGPTAPMAEPLLKLTTLLHDDILLVIRGTKLTKGQENSAWFKALSDKSVFVSCQTPEQAQLPRWVTRRAKELSLELDEPANQLLCYCYEGNLLALAQSLERLSLL
jgi:DNA polymerase-3 subunit delta